MPGHPARCLPLPNEWFPVRELRSQFANTLLLVLSAVAVVAAILNFQQLRKFPLPDDGVTWADQTGPGGTNPRVIAIHISPNSAGDKAQIRLGDELVKIDNTPIAKAIDVAR